jgi:flagellar motor switch protein FliM
MSDQLPNDPVGPAGEGGPPVTAGHVGTAPRSRRVKRIRELDFARPTKFSQDQQRRIARGHEGFCRTVQSQLSAELRTTVQLEVANVDQQTWSVAVNEIPAPSLYAIVATSAGLPLLFSVEQSAAKTMIERLLGGIGQDVGAAERDLTEIEIALATKIFLTLVTQLSRTWQELLSTDLTLSGVETQQTNIQLAPQSEPTLSVTIDLEIGELSTATATLLIPYRSVEVLLEQLPSGHYGDGGDAEPDAEVEHLLRSALRGVTVEVRAEVGSRRLTVDEVLELKPGDIVQLGPSSSGATLYADAVPIYRARPGKSANRRAVEVLERMEQL